MAGRPHGISIGAWLGRLALAAIFVFAGTSKVADPTAFALAIDRYLLVPFPVAAMLGIYLPWLEVTCGIGVLWQQTRIGSIGLLGLCCVMFFGAVTSALVRGLEIDCGCFGAGGIGSTLGFAAVRSAALAIVCVALILYESHKESR